MKECMICGLCAPDNRTDHLGACFSALPSSWGLTRATVEHTVYHMPCDRCLGDPSVPRVAMLRPALHRWNKQGHE